VRFNFIIPRDISRTRVVAYLNGASSLATAAYETKGRTDLSGVCHTLPKSRVEILLHGPTWPSGISARIGMRSKS